MHYIVAALIVVAVVLCFGYFLTTKANLKKSNPDRPARLFHEEECAICLEDKTYPVQASCAHEFCATCILNCLEKSSLCPLCRRKIWILFKNFEECPDDLRARLRQYHSFQDDRTYFEIICEAPLLLKRFFTHNDFQDLRTTVTVILLISVAIGYLFFLPFDIFDEEKYGFFGLIDDFGVVGGTLIYASVLIFKVCLKIALEG